MDVLVRLLMYFVVTIFARPALWFYRNAAESRRSRRSEAWTCVQGYLQSVEVGTVGSTWTLLFPEHLWVLRLAYSYAVCGEYYSGFHAMPFVGEQEAEQFSRYFSQGSPVLIRFRSDKPEQSVMRLGENLRPQ